LNYRGIGKTSQQNTKLSNLNIFHISEGLTGDEINCLRSCINNTTTRI
jgi:hypothetical protein